MIPTAEARIKPLLDPGEQLLWSGQPSVEVLAAAGTRGPARLAVAVVVVLATGVMLGRSRGELPVAEILAAAVAGMALLAFLGGVLRRRALRRYAESLSYAITDRRLLICEGDVITDAYVPSDVREANAVVPRTAGYADVVFERLTYTRHGAGTSRVWARAPDPSKIKSFAERSVWRERHVKAFKALPDADRVERRVRDWIRDHRVHALQTADDFVAEVTAGAYVSDEVASSLQRIENPHLGLKLDVPRDWEVKVRTRSAPTGKLAVEMIGWQPFAPDATWNTLLAEGELDVGVQLELVETPVPTLTPRKVGYGILFLLFGGRTVSVDRNVRRGAFEGFSLVRRNPSGGTQGPRSLQRHLVLHDGARQLVLVTQWIEDDRDLEELMEAVSASLVLG